VISWPSASIIGIEQNKIIEAHADSRSPQTGIPAREVAREEAGERQVFRNLYYMVDLL